MSDRSPLDRHTEALKTNTTVIAAAATAHAVQQERMIRAQKAQNELVKQQVELERQKYEEEERRSQAAATVRRYVLELDDQIDKVETEVAAKSRTEREIRNSVARLGYTYKTQIEKNESSLRDNEDIVRVAQLKKRIAHLDSSLTAYGFTVESSLNQVVIYFRELHGLISEISSIESNGECEFSFVYIEIADLKANADLDAEDMLDLIEDIKKKARRSGSLSVEKIAHEKSRAEGAVRGYVELLASAAELVTQGLTQRYLIGISGNMGIDVATELIPIAEQYSPGAISILRNSFDRWRDREKIEAELRSVITQQVEHYSECQQRVRQIAQEALQAINEEVYPFPKTKALLANADAVAPDVIFTDVLELGEARKTYKKLIWKYRWGVVRSVGLKFAKYILAPLLVLTLIGKLIEQSGQSKQPVQVNPVGQSNIQIQQPATPKEALSPSETQGNSGQVMTAPPIQGSHSTNIIGSYSLRAPNGSGGMLVEAGAGSMFDVSVSATTDSGCVANMERATGVIKENGMLWAIKLNGDGKTQCELEIKFDQQTAMVSENGCTEFHGVSCGFAGVYMKKSQ